MTMRPKAKFSCKALLLLLMAVGSQQQMGAQTVQAFDQAAGTLRLDTTRLVSITGQPPPTGSVEASNDRAVLLWLQNTRTPEMESNSWLTLERDPIFFSRALGIDMVKLTPKLNSGLRSFMAPMDEVLGTIKKATNRPRPYQQYTDLRPCLPREDSASFPSGHSTWYRAASELLADLLPVRRQRLLQVGFHAGASRVMCGVHFPSDVQAGQRLGAAGAQQIISSPQWRAFRDNPQIQAELQRLREVPETTLPLLVR